MTHSDRALVLSCLCGDSLFPPIKYEVWESQH